MTDFWGFWVLFVLGFGFCVVFLGRLVFLLLLFSFQKKDRDFS